MVARKILVVLILLSSCDLASEIIYDNVRHGVDCEDLPLISEVDSALENEMTAIEEILLLDSYVSVQPEDRCPEKGYVEIRYHSRSVRKIIQGILKRESFSLPVSLVNW